VITYVNPAVAVLLGVLLLGEHFTAGMAVGFPLILAGSVLAARHGSAGEPAVPEAALCEPMTGQVDPGSVDPNSVDPGSVDPDEAVRGVERRGDQAARAAPVL
jgi:hypothetical protein